jgi:hypothetical protein
VKAPKYVFDHGGVVGNPAVLCDHFSVEEAIKLLIADKMTLVGYLIYSCVERRV